jgi:hypothetical protein
MNGWYITDGNLYELETANRIELCNKDITELVIPDGVKDIWCWENKLTKLILPNTIEYINCYDNNLTELIIPDSVVFVHCINNNLTELIVPDNCIVECDNTCLVITRTMYNRSVKLKSILK